MKMTRRTELSIPYPGPLYGPLKKQWSGFIDFNFIEELCACVYICS